MVNFFRSLTRFKAATVLNLAGLSVAFASFLIIMMQVRYELTFDKGYATVGKLYQLDAFKAPGEKYNTTTPRGLTDQLPALSPGVEDMAFRLSYNLDVSVYDVEKGVSGSVAVPLVGASRSFPRVMGLERISGDFSRFERRKTGIIAESLAQRLFPGEDPVGRQLVAKHMLMTDTLEIVGLYRDLPKNSSTRNGLIYYMGDEDKDKPWSNWNFTTYLTVPSAEQIPQIEQLASGLLKQNAKWFFGDNPPQGTIVTLNTPSERYFSPHNNEAQKGNKATVYSLIGIAALILLVALINFVNFSMALVPRRIKSINTRKVLGSSTLSLRLNQLTDTLGLVLISLGLAFLAVYILSTSSFASLIDADMRFGANVPLIFMMAGIGVAAALLAGVYPAVYSTSFSPALVLKGSFGLSAQGRTLRTGLIGFQYVVSLALIIIAFFIHLQYSYMQKFDVGYQRENILTTSLTVPMYQKKEIFTERLKNHPDIVDVAYASGPVNRPVSWVSRMYKDKRIEYTILGVSPNFLSVMGIPVVEGRDFRESDELRSGTYIFNQMAQRAEGIGVGDMVQAGGGGSKQTEVVGIAHDFHFQPLHYGLSPLALNVYGTQRNWPELCAYIKTAGNDPAAAIRYVEEVMREMDPEAGALIDVEFLEDNMAAQYKKENDLASLITLFSLLAVLISTIGAFGLVMFEAQYRRKEIGVRKVFGATIGDILAMFNKRYIRIVGVCFVLAAPAAYYIAVQWQSNFTYKAPIAGWIFFVSLLIVLLITVTTVTLQSYRIAAANPVDSVKAE